jgi:hypothetical protein
MYGVGKHSLRRDVLDQYLQHGRFPDLCYLHFLCLRFWRNDPLLRFE